MRLGGEFSDDLRTAEDASRASELPEVLGEQACYRFRVATNLRREQLLFQVEQVSREVVHTIRIGAAAPDKEIPGRCSVSRREGVR